MFAIAFDIKIRHGSEIRSETYGHSRSRTGATLHQYSRNSDGYILNDTPSCSDAGGFVVYGGQEYAHSVCHL